MKYPAHLAYARTVTAPKPRATFGRRLRWILILAVGAWAVIGGVALMMWEFGRLLAGLLAYPLAMVSG